MSWDSACTESQTEINERQAETGLSSRIPCGMFIEDFMEKATGRCARSQMGFMTQTARPEGYTQRGKNRPVQDTIRRKSACFRKSEVQLVRAVKNSTFVGARRRFD